MRGYIWRVHLLMIISRHGVAMPAWMRIGRVVEERGDMIATPGTTAVSGGLFGAGAAPGWQPQRLFHARRIWTGHLIPPVLATCHVHFDSQLYWRFNCPKVQHRLAASRHTNTLRRGRRTGLHSQNLPPSLAVAAGCSMFDNHNQNRQTNQTNRLDKKILKISNR